MLSPELREFAQCPDRYTRLAADAQRHMDERVCVVQGTVWGAVSGIRVAADAVAALVEEVRALVPAEKAVTWWIDPDAQPPDLDDRLRALGFVEPSDRASVVHALAFDGEPPPGPGDVAVRCVDDFASFERAMEVMWEAFETPADRRARGRAHLQEEFDAHAEAGSPLTFLAELDGRPVGIGRSVLSDRGVFLIGGSVLPDARGRGVYRALVRARFEDAARRGTPGLIVEALPDTSYPILKRLGFEDVCTIRRLEDYRGGSAPDS